jgi:hypothetical protein
LCATPRAWAAEIDDAVGVVVHEIAAVTAGTVAVAVVVVVAAQAEIDTATEIVAAIVSKIDAVIPEAGAGIGVNGIRAGKGVETGAEIEIGRDAEAAAEREAAKMTKCLLLLHLLPPPQQQ